MYARRWTVTASDTCSTLPSSPQMPFSSRCPGSRSGPAGKLPWDTLFLCSPWIVWLLQSFVFNWRDHLVLCCFSLWHLLSKCAKGGDMRGRSGSEWWDRNSLTAWCPHWKVFCFLSSSSACLLCSSGKNKRIKREGQWPLGWDWMHRNVGGNVRMRKERFGC